MPLPCPDKELLLVDAGIHRHIEESHHHLGPGLLAPCHRGVGIGIVRIVL